MQTPKERVTVQITGIQEEGADHQGEDPGEDLGDFMVARVELLPLQLEEDEAKASQSVFE